MAVSVNAWDLLHRRALNLKGINLQQRKSNASLKYL